MTGQDQFDAGAADRVEQIEVLFAGQSEDAINTFVLQSCDQQIGCGESGGRDGGGPPCLLESIRSAAAYQVSCSVVRQVGASSAVEMGTVAERSPWVTVRVASMSRGSQSPAKPLS